MLHEKLPPSAASSVWKSARSNVGYAVLPESDIWNVYLLFCSFFFGTCATAGGIIFELESFIALGEFQPILPVAAWITLPQALYLACTSSSSFGFIPLVIVCTGCCLRAVLDDDVVGP